MADVDPIRIEGLRDLQKALKQMDGESQKLLRVVFNQAAETVIGGARRRVPSRTGTARRSLRALSGQRTAKAVGGSTRAAYYPWLDFGGNVGRNRAAARRFVHSGRYLYPSYAANRESIFASLQDAIVALAEGAGFEVT